MALPATERALAETPATPSYPHLAYSGGEPPASPRRPRLVDNGVLGMAIFLATETMIFAALISAFLILRSASATWPPPGQPRLPVGITAINTLILLVSAYGVRRALGASRRRDRTQTIEWLAVTAALGATFLIVQGTEWVHLLGFGLSASSGTYGATFYTLIGCHGLHVLAAVVLLLGILWGTVHSRSLERAHARLRVCQIYWLFVVAVWPILYVLVYLT